MPRQAIRAARLADRGCGKKKCFSSKVSARMQVYMMQHGGRARPNDELLDAYRCRTCGHWHVGHRSLHRKG
jgi:hypothetical protein